MVFFVFYVLSWVVAVGFADIDRIVDYYWFNVLFIISRFLVQWGKSFSRTDYPTVAPEFTSVFSEVCGGQYSGFYVLSCGPMGNQHLFLLYLTLYIIYKIKVMFLQNWYLRETSLLFTGRQIWCSMSVRKCIRFAFRNYNLDRKLKSQIWSLWKHKIKTHK